MTQLRNGVAVHDSMGAVLTGIEISLVLWGVGCVQLFVYLNSSASLKRLKLLAISVWLLDTVHQALLLHTIYFYLIAGYNKPSLLITIAPSLIVEVLFCALVCLIVQMFFVLRIWRFMHNFEKLSSMRHLATPLVVFLMTPVIASFVSSTIYAIRAFQIKALMHLDKIFTLGRLMNIFSASGDSVITISLVYLLRRAIRGLTGSKSETVINRIIIFTMGTGLITTLCAILALIMMSVLPNSFIYMAFYFNICRLYTNSLLATLNSRNYLGNGGGTQGDLEKPISLLCFADTETTSESLESAERSKL